MVVEELANVHWWSSFEGSDKCSCDEEQSYIVDGSWRRHGSHLSINETY